jgi:hypothetical protein
VGIISKQTHTTLCEKNAGFFNVTSADAYKDLCPDACNNNFIADINYLHERIEVETEGMVLKQLTLISVFIFQLKT